MGTQLLANGAITAPNRKRPECTEKGGRTQIQIKLPARATRPVADQLSSSLAAAYSSPESTSFFSCSFASSSLFVSYSFKSPSGKTFCTPPSPNTTLDEKYGMPSTTSDATYAHSVRFFPLRPASTDLAMRA